MTNKNDLIPLLFTADSDGNIYNKKTGRKYKGSANNSGYLVVGTTYNKKHYSFLAHRVIAILLIPNPNKYKIVNHINGNKLDNKAKNLEWCTYRHNACHTVKLGLDNVVLTEAKIHQIWQLRLDNPFMPNKSIAEAVNESLGNVQAVLNKKCWREITKDYPNYKVNKRLSFEALQRVQTQPVEATMSLYNISASIVNKIKANPEKYCQVPYLHLLE